MGPIVDDGGRDTKWVRLDDATKATGEVSKKNEAKRQTATAMETSDTGTPTALSDDKAMADAAASGGKKQ